MKCKSQTVVVKKDERIPFDGKIVDGMALVDESAQTGVSSPVLLYPECSRPEVIADTRIVDGWLKIEGCPSK